MNRSDVGKTRRDFLAAAGFIGATALGVSGAISGQQGSEGGKIYILNALWFKPDGGAERYAEYGVAGLDGYEFTLVRIPAARLAAVRQCRPVEEVVSHPWQEREDRGYPRAFVGTVWAALRSPRAFFAATSGRHGMRGPLLFGVAAGVLGKTLQVLVVVSLAALLARLFDLPALEASPLEIGSLDLSTSLSWALPLLGCQGVFLLVPVLLVIYVVLLFVVGGFTHLALWLLGGLRGSSEGFAGTFAVTCYATAAFPAQMIPVFGDLVFTVLVVILLSIGLRVVHDTTRAKALVAALAPASLLIVAIACLALLPIAGTATG